MHNYYADSGVCHKAFASNLTTAVNRQVFGKGAAERLPFSRRERAANHLQKSTDLAREAVGCNGLFGAPASIVRVPPACADHTGIVPRFP
jgi:hypothetical protein